MWLNAEAAISSKEGDSQKMLVCGKQGQRVLQTAERGKEATAVTF